MNKLPFYSHGERVHPDYANGAWGKSTDTERPQGQVSGIARRFKKHEEAAWNPQALGRIKATYDTAIEYTGVTTALMGLPFFGGVFAGVSGIVGAWMGLSAAFSSGGWLAWTTFIPIACIFVALSLYGFVKAWHETIRQPEDRPVIFERRRRKVYRIVREDHRGFWGVFRRWPVMACEYDWDLVDAEHNAELYTTGGTVSRNHALMFVVRKSAADPTIIDSFEVGNSADLSEELVTNLWEHIRRFMEENGPHLPTPDEPLAVREPLQSWWQAMGDVGPYGPKLGWWWREMPALTIFMLLLLPVMLPVYVLWGTGNWLSRKTAKKYHWPEAVKVALGPRRSPQGGA
jgi:hypothetical protein